MAGATTSIGGRSVSRSGAAERARSPRAWKTDPGGSPRTFRSHRRAAPRGAGLDESPRAASACSLPFVVLPTKVASRSTVGPMRPWTWESSSTAGPATTSGRRRRRAPPGPCSTRELKPPAPQKNVGEGQTHRFTTQPAGSTCSLCAAGSSSMSTVVVMSAEKEPVQVRV